MRKLLTIILILFAAAGTAHAEIRAATKIALGATTNFTLDKDEDKDFSIQFAKGTYYIVLDAARTDARPDCIFSNVQLLKSNGTVVNKKIADITEVAVATRTVKAFTVTKPFAARIRITNEDSMVDYWMTIVPAAKMKFFPFGFKNGDLKPLAIGAEEGKGGTLEHHEYAFHSIKLPAGKYTVSLYFRRTDGKRSSMLGGLTRMDSFGNVVPMWRINISDMGKEVRHEQQLVLTKPQNVIFRVLNTDEPVDYVIGVEKQ